MIHNLHRTDGTLLYVKECDTVSECLRSALDNAVDLTGILLRNADLSNLHHPEIHFKHAVFECCSFDNVSFENATFTQCGFDRCIISDCNFVSATFKECEFCRTYMSLCLFSNACMDDVIWKYVAADGINMRSSAWDKVILEHVSISANWDSAVASGIQAQYCEISHTSKEPAVFVFVSRSAVALRGNFTCNIRSTPALRASLFENLQNQLRTSGLASADDVDDYAILRDLAFGSEPNPT